MKRLLHGRGIPLYTGGISLDWSLHGILLKGQGCVQTHSQGGLFQILLSSGSHHYYSYRLTQTGWGKMGNWVSPSPKILQSGGKFCFLEGNLCNFER